MKNITSAWSRRAKVVSQSLIHQISVSDTYAIFKGHYITTSQSLIHQVSVSDSQSNNRFGKGWFVSIPYSSGLSFRFGKVGNCTANRRRRSQSLIHQVSVSDFLPRVDVYWVFAIVSIPYSSGLSFRWRSPYCQSSQNTRSLNPLFIRSQFQILMLWSVSPATIKICLNPLFIRSQFQIQNNLHRRCRNDSVSIPYSSGLRFR